MCVVHHLSNADPRVICFVDWTANLTQHFRRQSDNTSAESGVTYQYFGGTLGALRFFPGGDHTCIIWRNNYMQCNMPYIHTCWYPLYAQVQYIPNLVPTSTYSELCLLDHKKTGR